MESARSSVLEGKKNAGMLSEHVQTLQSELGEMELKRGELEGQLQQHQEVGERGDRVNRNPHCVQSISLQG